MADHYKSCGLYVGSFDPFHKGHQNILDKAKNIFDVVLVGIGNNPDKSKRFNETGEYSRLPDGTDVFYYDGWTTRLVEVYRGMYRSVTIVRGVRNSTDYSYEMNQLAYMRELLSDVEIVLIPCDKKFEHISSSSLKKLAAIGKQFNHYVVPIKSV